jgi:hypothetical protein
MRRFGPLPFAALRVRVTTSHAFDPRTRLEAGTQHTHSRRRREIRLGAPRGVIAVAMSDDGPIHRLPGVDEEVAGLAVEAAIGEAEEGHA